MVLLNTIILEPLDREQVDLLKLVVTASDGGNKTDEMIVTLVIDDDNDMTPVFTNLQNYTVKEVKELMM